ncbi:MAG: bifunctional hydroxymethylpyrimidine kinase/phosphomethylpyrimidine kinase, partial [Spirochaetales bacterium]
AVADYVLPNITEACFLTGIEYKENYDEAYVKSLVKGLLDLGAKNVVLTGVGYKANETGVVVSDGKSWKHYVHRKIAKGCHGTGDVYASAFTGALLRGHSAYDSAVIAADYVVDCIEVTQQDKDHTYGVEFERTIPQLIEKL